MLNKIKRAIGRRILKNYKSRKQKSFNGSIDHCLSSARAMLKKSKYCFLITNGEKAWPSARMVQPIINYDTWDIWFGTNPTLRKVKEIEKNPNVTIAFGKDRDNANIIIYGKATIVHDLGERKKHWIGSWVLFFPGGPKGDDFVSIRVEPVEIELMDFKRNIVPEPFGLKPARLIKDKGNWTAQDEIL
jgi:general stress protein 26